MRSIFARIQNILQRSIFFRSISPSFHLFITWKWCSLRQFRFSISMKLFVERFFFVFLFPLPPRSSPIFNQFPAARAIDKTVIRDLIFSLIFSPLDSKERIEIKYFIFFLFSFFFLRLTLFFYFYSFDFSDSFFENPREIYLNLKWSEIEYRFRRDALISRSKNLPFSS